MVKFFAVLLVAFWAGGARAEDCTEIKFAPGTSSGEVSGTVIEGRPVCLSFGSGAGQTARLQLFGSDNACFTVFDVVDCQIDYSFRTERKTYTLNVFQLFPSPSYEQFTFRLTIH